MIVCDDAWATIYRHHLPRESRWNPSYWIFHVLTTPKKVTLATYFGYHARIILSSRPSLSSLLPHPPLITRCQYSVRVKLKSRLSIQRTRFIIPDDLPKSLDGSRAHCPPTGVRLHRHACAIMSNEPSLPTSCLLTPNDIAPTVCIGPRTRLNDLAQHVVMCTYLPQGRDDPPSPAAWLLARLAPLAPQPNPWAKSQDPRIVDVPVPLPPYHGDRPPRRSLLHPLAPGPSRIKAIHPSNVRLASSSLLAPSVLFYIYIYTYA